MIQTFSRALKGEVPQYIFADMSANTAWIRALHNAGKFLRDNLCAAAACTWRYATAEDLLTS